MIIRAMLGPQRQSPNVAAVLRLLGCADGPVCTVTAGWQEREGELHDLEEHIATRALDLALYERGEDVFGTDTEFRDAYRLRQDSLMTMQRLYRRRLRHAMAAVDDLEHEDGDSPIVRDEQRAAMRALRTLDNQHLKRIARAHNDFEAGMPSASRPRLVAHRNELASVLRHAKALLVAGGHVQVLLNRLRLFDLLALAGDTPIVAWSAGAMCISDRIVLFHDSPPQGPGQAEIADCGLGLVTGVVPLPHASSRLELDNAVRVSRFARRFSPASSVTLDPGAALIWQDGHLARTAAVEKLHRNGAKTPVTIG